MPFHRRPDNISLINLLVIVAVYVDDLIIGATKPSYFEELKTSLSEKFVIRDLSDLSYCLGIEFKQTKHHISISQTKYIDDLLNQFNMSMCKPISTPTEPRLKLKKPEDEEELFNMPYQSLIGSLMYPVAAEVFWFRGGEN